MCERPIFRADLGHHIPCKKCNECIGQLISFKAAQAVMESLTSTLSVAVTLTFGPEHDHHAHTLDKRVFQRWMKRLRKRGYAKGFTVRYIVAGEYGSLKGRAHFHALLFFSGVNLPTFDYQNRQWNWDLWKYGYTFADEVTYATARYVCKYMSKHLTDRSGIQKSWNSASTVPPLGDAYYSKLSRMFAKAGKAPRDRRFSIAGVEIFRKAKIEKNEFGEERQVSPAKKVPLEIFMPSHVFDAFCLRFLHDWARFQGDRNLPTTEVFEKFLDRQAKAEKEANPFAIFDRLKRDGSGWTPNQLERLATFRLSPDGEYIIARTVSGTYCARRYDDDSKTEAEVILYSRGQIRKALEGRLVFGVQDYFQHSF